uniref:Uncharacterized protein n=1 Tax=Salix viminalis TaxID=40686 RepID=A0A6N2N5F3_SALVM
MGDRYGLWAEEHVGSKQSPSALLPRSTPTLPLNSSVALVHHPARRGIAVTLTTHPSPFT